MVLVVANGAPFFVQAYVNGGMPPLATAVSATESPLRTTPAGAPEIDTDAMLKVSAPIVIGGIEARAGEGNGTGTKPAATRAATSGPATPPTALPIKVSSPPSWLTGPRPPANRPIRDGAPLAQAPNTTAPTPRPT